MSKRAEESDSSGLILDTLCNTFGGIILIALLLALMTQETRERVLDEVEKLVLNDRLKVVQSDLTEAQEMRKRLDEELQSIRSAEYREALLKEQQGQAELEDLRQEMHSLQAVIQAFNDDSGASLENRVEATSATLGDIEDRRTAILIELERVRAENQRLQKRKQEIAVRIDNEKERRKKRVRFPKEQETAGKSSSPFIIRHGGVYPLLNPSTGIGANTESLEWNDFETIATAIAGSGIDVTTRSGSNQMKRAANVLLDKNTYAALYVYPDSFGQFTALKELLLDAGFRYGLELCKADEILLWTSSGGTSPPPQ